MNPRTTLYSLILAFLTMLSATAGKNTVIILDAGHGGKDNGAVWGGVREATLTLSVAKKVEAILKQKGVPVRMTRRRSTTYFSPTQRAVMANRYSDAIFVSIHFNASRNTKAQGVETFYASAKGRAVAANIQRHLVAKVKTRNRGVKYGLKYAVINKTKCPAVIVECGFISNSWERKRCNTGWYQTLAARGIAEGIIRSR